LQSVEALVELFRNRGLKITPQRRVVFEALVDDDSHPTAEEIYHRVSSLMPDISRTTVYNTLRELVALSELAIVKDLSDDGNHYDTDTTQHHHLSCMRCHALVDIHHGFEGLELGPGEAQGYRVLRSQVTFYGYCPNCRET
jgi:Fe2+ or Zn2+ uptake regulation protein